MFTYYINSLHDFREKNLEFGKAATEAWMEVLAHLIEGQYILGQVILHPSANPEGEHHPDVHWERVLDKNQHQHLVMKWMDDGVEKANRLRDALVTTFSHQATGWNDFTGELIQKLKADAGPEYAEALALMGQALDNIAATESATLKAAQQVAKNAVAVSKKPAAAKATVARKPAAAKPAAKSAKTPAKKPAAKPAKKPAKKPAVGK